MLCELTPKVRFSAAPVRPYIELMNVTWDPTGGNVILIVPMGREAIRVHDESAVLTTAPSPALRRIATASQSSSLPIIAPNGADVGTIVLAGTTSEASIAKDTTARVSLGVITLSINASNLRFGDEFRRPPLMLSSALSVDGGQPRTWDYTVDCSFDGTAFMAKIRPLSVALRNANLAIPMANVDTSEEIEVVASAGGLALRATAEAPQASAVLEAHLILRDI